MVHRPIELLLVIHFAVTSSVISVQTNSIQPILTNGDSVDLTLTYMDRNRLRLRCDAKGIGAGESLVLLSCPIVHTGVCKQNCLSPCPIIDGVPTCRWNTGSPIKSCRQVVHLSDRVAFEYDIEVNNATAAGHWRCMFRGRSSNSVRIQYQPADGVTTTITPTESTKLAYTSTEVEAEPAVPEVHSRVQFEFVTQLPLEVLVFILTLACLSIIFNFWFLIRCIRMKVHLRAIRNSTPKRSWLDQLACVHPPITWEDRYCWPQNRPNYVSANQILYPYASSPLTGTRVLSGGQDNTFTLATPYLQPTSTSTTETLLSGTARIGLARQSDTIYDDVHNSVYAMSLTHPGRRRGMEQLQPASTLVTYDGQEWMLDHSGQFYLPRNLHGPVYERQLYMPLATTDWKDPSEVQPVARMPTPCPMEQTQYYSNATRDAPPLPIIPDNSEVAMVSKNNRTTHKIASSIENPIKIFDPVDAVSLVTLKPAYTEPNMCTNPLNSSGSSRSVSHGRRNPAVTPNEHAMKPVSSTPSADPVSEDMTECLPPRTQELIRKGSKSYLEEWTFSD